MDIRIDAPTETPTAGSAPASGPPRGLTPAELAAVDRRLVAVNRELRALSLLLAVRCGFGGRRHRQQPADRLAAARQAVAKTQTQLQERWAPDPAEAYGWPPEGR